MKRRETTTSQAVVAGGASNKARRMTTRFVGVSRARGQPEQAKTGRTGKPADTGRAGREGPARGKMTEWSRKPEAPRETDNDTDTFGWNWGGVINIPQFRDAG